jgi:hypothetical protein
MAASKEELQSKTKRLNAAGSKVEAFIAAGGDLGSPEGMSLGMELNHAFNDVSTEFGHPILKKIAPK